MILYILSLSESGKFIAMARGNDLVGKRGENVKTGIALIAMV